MAEVEAKIAEAEALHEGSTDNNDNAQKETVTSNQGNEIDVTKSSNHSTSSKNPGTKGEPNSSVDILNKNGEVTTRRWYDAEGNAYRDVDFTDHGNPSKHPEVPHEHFWDWSNGTPIRM